MYTTYDGQLKNAATGPDSEVVNTKRRPSLPRKRREQRTHRSDEGLRRMGVVKEKMGTERWGKGRELKISLGWQLCFIVEPLSSLNTQYSIFHPTLPLCGILDDYGSANSRVGASNSICDGGGGSPSKTLKSENLKNLKSDRKTRIDIWALEIKPVRRGRKKLIATEPQDADRVSESENAGGAPKGDHNEEETVQATPQTETRGDEIEEHESETGGQEPVSKVVQVAAAADRVVTQTNAICDLGDDTFNLSIRGRNTTRARPPVRGVDQTSFTPLFDDYYDRGGYVDPDEKSNRDSDVEPPTRSHVRQSISPRGRMLSPKSSPIGKLPPSSPPPEEDPRGSSGSDDDADVESEADHSSDDYGDAQAKLQKQNSWNLARGLKVIPSPEDDDEDDERDFDNEVERDGMEDEDQPRAAGKGRRRSKSAKAAPGTSKQRAATSKPKRTKRKVAAAAGTDNTDSESGSIVVDDEDERHKGGPIPTAVKEKLSEIYDNFTAQVDELAKSCGKSSASLHRELGTTAMKTPRETSAWNMWQRWFAEQTPKEQREADFTKQSRAAFVAKCKVGPDFPEEMLKDSDAVFERLPWLRDWNKNVKVQAVAGIREGGKLKRRLQAEVKPVTRLATQLLATYDVHMWGYVIDPDGQGSFLFGAGDDFKEMRKSEMVNLNQAIKDQEHTFGSIAMRKRGLAAHSMPVQNLDPHAHEKGRDVYRRQFTAIVGGQLWEFCRKAKIPQGDVDKRNFLMKWGPKFIDVARECQCRIINYPTALRVDNQIIGTNAFKLKKIKTATFAKFMEALVNVNANTSAAQDNTDVLQVVPWDSEEMLLPLEDQGDVPVVVDEDGMALVWVKSSDGYHDEVKKEAKKVAKEMKKKKGRVAAVYDRNDEPRPPVQHQYHDRYHDQDNARLPPAGQSAYEYPEPPRLHRDDQYIDYRQDYDGPVGYPLGRDFGYPYGRERNVLPRSPPHAEASRSYERRGTSRQRTRTLSPLSEFRPQAGPTQYEYDYRRASWRPPPIPVSPLPEFRAQAGPSTQYDYGRATSRPPPRPASPVPEFRQKAPSNAHEHHGGSDRRSKSSAPADAVRGHQASNNGARRDLDQHHSRPYHRISHLDLAKEADRAEALAARTGGKRKRQLETPEAEASDRETKRPREASSTTPLIRLRTQIPHSHLGKAFLDGRVFYATDLLPTDPKLRARAHRYTYVFNPATSEWLQLQNDRVPAFATPDDRERFERNILEFNLED
ncbi:hypothetical protein B0H12DRAFT_1076632 [Mycena haematopus]|nr:hypothetical protein B0H12DRAFT_1076632 [Mycena haematopus]